MNIDRKHDCIQFSIPIFIVSRTPGIIILECLKQASFLKLDLHTSRYAAWIWSVYIFRYFSRDLQFLSSDQTRTRGFRTRNVTELKYTDKQTSFTKAFGCFLNNPNARRIFHVRQDVTMWIRHKLKNSCPQASDVIYLFQSLSLLVINR